MIKAVVALGLVLTSAGPLGLRAQGGTRYLVIPFDNVQREARLYWLSEGSAVALTDDLLALGAPAITREDRLRAFESLNVPPVASLSHATVIRLGQLVGASHVVIGGFEQKEGTLHIRARAIRLDTGRMLPEVLAHGPLSQLLHIYAGAARQLAGGSGSTVEQIEHGQPPLAAFEQYIKGVLAESPAAKLGTCRRRWRSTRGSNGPASRSGMSTPSRPSTNARSRWRQRCRAIIPWHDARASSRRRRSSTCSGTTRR